MTRWLKPYPVLALFLGMALLFRLFPGIDLLVTGWFFVPGEGFIFNDHPLIQLSYLLFAKVHFFVFAALLWLLFASWFWRRSAERGLRKRLWFLVVVLLLGPGLMVNEVLKGNSGRARPLTVTQFDGEKTFSAAFAPSDQCQRNCSFVSGHAGMGFFLIALAWVFRDRRWLWAGITLGALVGLGRVVQGAHFLSDVVFAFWTVFGTCLLFAHWILGDSAIEDGSDR